MTGTVLSAMLAVESTPAAVAWYRDALGARLLWDFGSVAGLEIEGAPFFLHEQVSDNGFESPRALGATTARIELFAGEPDRIIAAALAHGAEGSLDDIHNYDAPWGKHRQGGFVDPFGHVWLVGDKSPLSAFP